MRTRAFPKRDIEYTFDFGGGRRYTLVYDGIDERTGRLRFFNPKSKTFTTMRKERFSYIHRFNLRAEAPYVDKIPFVIPESRADDTFSEMNKIIKTLSNLTKENREKVIYEIGKTPETLIRDLTTAKDDVEFGRYMLEYFRAYDVFAGNVKTF